MVTVIWDEMQSDTQRDWKTTEEESGSEVDSPHLGRPNILEKVPEIVEKNVCSNLQENYWLCLRLREVTSLRCKN
jgi:hypothetical protein